jgi:hypothetical protein
MRTWLKQLVGDQKARADEVAFYCIVWVISYIAIEIYWVCVRGQAFEPEAYAKGFVYAIGPICVAMGLKSRLERDPRHAHGPAVSEVK